ncbi:MAG: VCBS repeat-containing protein, partial [Phycisphaerales bacterium]|nr:VCBS repeat-containing protein [Phycisphaerales bacterium]
MSAVRAHVLARIATASVLSVAAPTSRAIADAGSSPMRFEDATAESGIDLTLTSGRMPSTAILEVKGGGIALIDFDGDGDRDLFFPNGATLEDPERGPGARLYENLGGLRFRDVSAGMGVRHARWSFGAAVGDVDGDGRDDLYVCCFGPDVLLRNLGGGRFEDISARAGLGDPGWSTSAGFADLDADGDLDLFVVNYVEFDPTSPPPPAQFKGMVVLPGPNGFTARADLLYENLGDGTFRDVSEPAGIRRAIPGFGLNLSICDFDHDGRPDILVGNDSEPNSLFANRTEPGGPMRFEERGL